MVLTVVVGFSWGGWVTGGTAASRAKDAAEDATAQLAANICAFRFLRAGDAATQLAALKKESSYSQKSAIEDGGWVTLAGAKEPVEGAAALCADQLAKADLQAQAAPVAEAAASTTPS
jgi:hypothetical protein